MRADNGEEYLSQGRLAVERRSAFLPRWRGERSDFKLRRFSPSRAQQSLGPLIGSRSSFTQMTLKPGENQE